MTIMENEGMPRIMQKDNTYTCTESYVSDMLTVHDTYFLSKPKAAHDDKDCRGRLAVKMLLRGLICSRFSSRLTYSIEETLSRFWCENVDQVIEKKLVDHKMYDIELRRLFNEQERTDVQVQKESVIEMPHC